MDVVRWVDVVGLLPTHLVLFILHGTWGLYELSPSHAFSLCCKLVLLEKLACFKDSMLGGSSGFQQVQPNPIGLTSHIHTDPGSATSEPGFQVLWEGWRDCLGFRPRSTSEQGRYSLYLWALFTSLPPLPQATHSAGPRPKRDEKGCVRNICQIKMQNTMEIQSILPTQITSPLLAIKPTQIWWVKSTWLQTDTEKLPVNKLYEELITDAGFTTPRLQSAVSHYCVNWVQQMRGWRKRVPCSWTDTVHGDESLETTCSALKRLHSRPPHFSRSFRGQ